MGAAVILAILSVTYKGPRISRASLLRWLGTVCLRPRGSGLIAAAISAALGETNGTFEKRHHIF